ncbi:MAG: hypothetical protein QGH59_04020, partial [Gemmatimonadota bacterium]|nr:hypothetical protein [Gemmatimonadota bacterium]
LPDGVGLENTFREWQQTNLSGMGVECQTCHMKTYTGRAATDSPVREGIHRHTVVGVDYAYAPFQGIDLEAQKADIQDLLENAVSVSVEGIPAEAAPGEALDVVVRVTNDQTGHSIPSGVSFSREMWVSIAVTDSAGASVYRSGYLLANGDLVTVAEDPDLTLFHSKLYDADGERTLLSFVATSIDDSLLLPYMSTRTAHYPVTVPAAASGPLTVEIMLRFRPIAPPILRAIDLPELLPIEIFDMWSASYTVAVTG